MGTTVKGQTNYRGYESSPSPARPKCKYAKTTVKDVTCEKAAHTGSVDKREIPDKGIGGASKNNTEISNPQNHMKHKHSNRKSDA